MQAGALADEVIDLGHRAHGSGDLAARRARERGQCRLAAAAEDEVVRRRSQRRTDDRDKEIGRRADALCFMIFSILAAIPMALGLAGFSTFWMTNTLFLAFSLAAVANVVIRAIYYRKGVL